MLRRTVLALVCCGILPAVAVAADDQYFDSRGVKIRYTVEGRGEPVLLMHGFIANIEMQWGLPGIIKGLAKDYQVIALDNRGHGKSGKPHDPEQYGMEMVEDAVRLLDHLKIKKAHVVGYSMGAMITNKLLVTHPERLLSATLGGAAGFLKGSDTTFFDNLADSLEQGKGMAILIEALTPPGQPKPSAEQIDAINTLVNTTNDTKALAAVVRSWKQLALTKDQLKTNRVPTLGLVGDLDPLKKGMDELKADMTKYKLVVIKGTDHMTAFGKPEFIDTLKEFLDRHSAKSKARERETVPPRSP
jgi:pimeloyl-ACP methyl ester carboxylesterase